jgi:PilZ domain
VPVRKSQRKFRPGELAPITGIYLVYHGSRHRDPHEVVIIRGELLPACRTCKQNTSFDIVKVISHVTHDWDFSGPHNLAVRPLPEQFADFRVFRRVNIRLPITLQLPRDSNPVSIHGYSSDLSAGGLGAIIRDKLPLAYKSATVKIDVGPGTTPVSLRARFRHQSGLRYGFEFMSIAGAEREVIRRMIEKHMKAAASSAS